MAGQSLPNKWVAKAYSQGGLHHHTYHWNVVTMVECLLATTVRESSAFWGNNQTAAIIADQINFFFQAQKKYLPCIAIACFFLAAKLTEEEEVSFISLNMYKIFIVLLRDLYEKLVWRKFYLKFSYVNTNSM